MMCLYNIVYNTVMIIHWKEIKFYKLIIIKLFLLVSTTNIICLYKYYIFTLYYSVQLNFFMIRNYDEGV